MINQNFDIWLARISTQLKLSIWFFPLPQNRATQGSLIQFVLFLSSFLFLKILKSNPTATYSLFSSFPLLLFLKLIKMVEWRVTHHLKIQFFFFFFNYINFHHLFYTNMSCHINIIQFHKLSSGYLGYKVQRRCIHL